MMTILFFASETGKVSQARTLRITQAVVDFTVHMLPKKQSSSYLTVRSLHYYIRKSGHVVEYFMLAFSLMIAVNLRKPVKGWTVVAIMVFSIICACLDEYYQTLLQGRSGRIKDIWIDTLGAATGVLTYNISRLFLKKTKLSKFLLKS